MKIINLFKSHYLSIIFFIIFSIIRFYIITDINKNGFKFYNTAAFILTSLIGFYNLCVQYKKNEKQINDRFNLFINKLKTK